MVFLFSLSILFFLFIFSRFGASLAARNALVWWIMAAFIGIGELYPAGYNLISAFLGFQQVSNFVFAAMIVFLLFFVVQLSGHVTDHSRRFRTLVARGAAKDFLERSGDVICRTSAEVLIVLPCFNEEESLVDLIPRLQTLRIPFCIVDDGSSDRSHCILQEMAPHNYARHMANSGVSTALLTGFEIADQLGVKYVVQCDSDGQHPVENIPQLVEAAKTWNTDMLIGSRFVSHNLFRGNLESTSVSRRFGGVVLALTLFLCGRGVRVSDPTSGFRVYSRRAIHFLKNNMPDDYPEPESIVLLALQEQNIAESLVQMRARSTGQSSIVGINSLLYMMKVVTAILGVRIRRGLSRLT